MDKGQIGWIDPAAARRLMLEYRQMQGLRGASEIERRIAKHTKGGIGRKTIEDWLNDPDSTPSHRLLKTVLLFFQSEHFQDVVPRARDYLDSDARFCRIGEALFDLYGTAGLPLSELEESNARLAGWWSAERVYRRNSPGPSFLCITPVTGRPFSKIHVLIRSDEVPIGSGITFPKGDSHGRGEQLARIFSKELYFREKTLLLSPRTHGQESPALDATFSPRNDPVEFPGASFIKVRFSRTDESAVPAEVRDIFDNWNRSVLPRDLGSRGLLVEGSRNEAENLQGSPGEAFAAVRQRDEEIASRSPLED